MARTPKTLGELISTVYEEFLAHYEDEELASVATAAVINDWLQTPKAAAAQVNAGETYLA
ncbi:MAG: hypothetical protein AAB865_01225 [Patescibacteria group bacterium]